MAADLDVALLRGLWATLGGKPAATETVDLAGPLHALPSVFEVTALASAAVGLAALAAADLGSLRTGGARRPVRIDRPHAAFAFRRELHASPIGWQIPPLWDPIAGDYRARDGWIRLHTNYPHHRAAALRVLGGEPERAAVGDAVARWQADDLERAIVEAGGCAAAMRTLAEWREHPQGRAVACEAPIALERRAGTERSPRNPPRAARELPLAGMRVLDLTRVLAGPVCTTFLGSLGADVLRVDPPGFEEMAAILCETSAAKRRARLDLAAPDGVARFEQLARDADVLVVGYRTGALERHGLDARRLRSINPSLVVARLVAYGWSGPWAERRGFDSLVQMSSGIAARGADEAGKDRPVPLPAQALDHATGYLLAAGICRALAERCASGSIAAVRLSLARTAELLVGLGQGGDPSIPLPSAEDLEPWMETVATTWGPLRRIRHPGSIDGLPFVAPVEPGPLGMHEASWIARAA